MIPQTTELSQIQAAFIDKDNRIEELMRQINSAQSLLNSLKESMNSIVGDGKITIQTYAGSNVGDFTVNQKENKTITLPQQATVNNGKLTIQKNGTSVGTFTANQSGNTTANISVPTKTSEITNDSDFVSDANYVHTDNNFTNADKAEIGKINNSLQFTYVVDNDQKLADWANNVAGNDYTSVLIKKGEYSLSGNKREYINLTDTGTKSIVGETGAKIIVNSTTTSSLFRYTTVPNTPEYYIENLSVTMTCPRTGSASIIFHRCINIKNCIGEITQSRYGRIFTECKNIDNCLVIDCVGSGSGYGFQLCYSVRNCIVLHSTSPNTYLDSYSSPTADPTYACANTLEGGWNTTV